MEQKEPPVERALAEPTPAQGCGEEDPVERIDYAWLTLADEILPCPFVGAPEWEAAVVPFAGLELQPGEDLAGEIMPVEPGVLVCEEDAPEAKDQKSEEQAGTRKTAG